MSAAIQPTLFDYASVDAETRIVVQQRTSEIKSLMKRAAQDIIDIGEKLTEVKQRLGHGRFGAWLAAEFQWSERTARSIMGVAETFKTANFADLEIAPSALYALAAPSVPQAARVAAIERAQAGEQITYTAAKQIIEDHAPQALRLRARAERDAALPAPPLALETGPFDVLYVDPPWRYEHVETENRAIENHYPTMDLPALCAFDIWSIVPQDCVLFLWATSPKLAEALELIKAWGFNYRTCAVWVKDKIGMGYYFRQRHELLLVATKGKPGTPEPSDRTDSVITAPRLEHSAKPEQVYGLIEAMYPRARKAELFARNRRSGWAAWGNQA